MKKRQPGLLPIFNFEVCDSAILKIAEETIELTIEIEALAENWEHRA